MKNSGFTLIELLAVIAIMAIILVLTVPMILNSRDNTLRGISREEERNLKYAGELVGIDLDEYMSDIYNCNSTSWINDKCTRADGKWLEVKVSVADLKEHGYFEDVKGHCEGEMTITKLASSDYNVTLNSIKC